MYIISTPITKLLDKAYFKLDVQKQLRKRNKKKDMIEITCSWPDVCDLIKEAYEKGYEDRNGKFE